MTAPAYNARGPVRPLIGLVLPALSAWAGCAPGSMHAPDRQAGFAPVAQSPPRGPAASAAPRGGADALAGSMRRAIALSGASSWGEVLISADGVRNQSHAARQEFEAMRRRLVDALSEAGRGGGVPMRFVLQPGGPVDFELNGTAYLVTAGGFDLWELYLELRPEGRSWSIWSTDGPIKMLRQPRGDQDFVDP